MQFAWAKYVPVVYGVWHAYKFVVTHTVRVFWLPSTLGFLHPRLWRKQSTQYVFVYRTVIVHEASRTPRHCFPSQDSTFKNWRDIFYLAYYCGCEAVTGMKNPEKKSKKEDVTRNAYKKLEGLHLPSLLQKVCAHMNQRDSTLRTTQNYIDALISEQWVIFHLDHRDNKQYVNQTAGMCQCCSFSALGLARSTTFFTSVQLPMQRSEQKLQRWALRN